mgnify:CR=1 FL=1
MIDTDKYEGHTEGPWEQYSAAAYHAVVLPDDIELIPPKLADAQLIADAPLLLEEVKRLREALVGDSEDWTTDELVEKALTLYDKALVFDAIYDWHTRMQLQGEGIEYNLDRMDWLLKNPTKEYEDYEMVFE